MKPVRYKESRRMSGVGVLGRLMVLGGVASLLAGLLVLVVGLGHTDPWAPDPVPTVAVLTLGGLFVARFGMVIMNKETRQITSSRLCKLCGQKIGLSKFFVTDSKLNPGPAFLHDLCYRDALKQQRKRCSNCSTPLYISNKSDLVIPVVVGESKRLFCSKTCSVEYRPLQGLIASPPTQLRCNYCGAVFSSQLAKCPQCGASRSKLSTEGLLNSDPHQFEQTIADLLTRMGYSGVSRIGGPGDKAVDITATRNDELGVKRRYAVQCKRYGPSLKVGSREMQVFCSMIGTFHDYERGIYVTTSSFTDEAKIIGEKFDVVLVDGRLLDQLLAQYS